MTTNLRRRLLCIFTATGLMVTAGCQTGIGRYMPKVGMPEALARKNERKASVQQSGASSPRITERNYAQVQLALGDSLAKEGNVTAAQSAYEAAIRNDDKLAAAYHRLALLREKTGDRSDAKDLLQRAIELDPKNAELACDYGYCCYLRQDWNEAQKQFERAIQLDPNLKRAHNNLGLVYARTDRADDALRRFEMAGLSPADARANLGFVYLTQKRFPQAKAELQLAAAATPSSTKAQEILARFDKIETSAQPTANQPAPPQPIVAGAPAPSIQDQFEVATPQPAAEIQRVAAETPRVARAEAPRPVTVASQPPVEVPAANSTSDRNLPTQQLAPVLSDYQF